MQPHPELRRCVAYCVDCGIRFLTHPRNADRRNLRCPFGCREHHRRQCSCQRSTAYYQTPAGKAKKKRLNARRQGSQLPPAAPPQGDLDPQGMSPGKPPSDPSSATAELPRDDVVLDEASLARSPMLPYVRMVVSLIEGVRFTCHEILDRLRQALRQHRIGTGNKIEYLLGFLHRHPP